MPTQDAHDREPEGFPEEKPLSQEGCELLARCLAENGVSDEEVAAESEPLPIEACACGGAPELSVEHDPAAAADLFRYRCDSCLAEGPLAGDEPSARTLWNLFAAEERRQWPPCDRCGEPTAPDGYHARNGLAFCAICAEDLGFA